MSIKSFFTLLFLLTVADLSYGQDSKTTVDAVKEEIVKEDASNPNAGKPQKMERMEVTGSHIKRVDVEGPSPITTIDRKQLEKSGYNSVGDVMRNMTAATSGVGRETAYAGGASTGASTMSLRGMSSDNVLILLDGRRLPVIGGSSSVDLNLIPMAAIERIEVLKDGASATYGSDALGGVINFITKKNYEGAQVSMKYSHPQDGGGMRTDVSGTFGKVGKDYSFLGVLTYRHNEALYFKERDFGRLSLNEVNQWSSYGSPGSWQDATTGTFTPAADCPASQKVNGICKFDYSPYAMITPQMSQYSTMLSATYDITPEIKTFARILGTKRDTFSRIAPPPDSFDDSTSTGGLNTQLSPAQAAALGITSTNPINIFYRLVDEAGAGPRENKGSSYSMGLQTGVSGYLTDTWEWQVGGSYMGSSVNDVGTGGYANKQLLYNKITATPTPTFNPFATAGNKSNITDTLYQPSTSVTSTIGGLDAKVSGELFDLPAGPASLAVGMTSFWQTYKEDGDDITKSGAQWGGGGVVTGSGQRNFQSLFTELGLVPLEGLEVQIAGRFDKYSDFGNAANPKLGLKYKPVSFLMLRSSWGTGFKAPALSELYQGRAKGFPNAIDTVKCPPGTTGIPECDQQQVETVTGGNPNLKNENSQSLNLGLVLEPIKNLSFGVDYFRINQTSVVRSLSDNDGLQNVFDAERIYGNAYLNTNYGINVIRDGAGKVQRVIAPYTNVSSNVLEGLDLNLSFKTAAFLNWDFISSVDHTIMLTNKNEPFPGLAVIDYNGLAGNPKWRNNITLGLSNPDHSLALVIRTIAGQKRFKERASPGCCGSVRDHTEVDLNYTLKGLWEKSTFTLGVLNLFATNRPFDTTNFSSIGYINTSLYDPFGRSIYMGYTQDF